MDPSVIMLIIMALVIVSLLINKISVSLTLLIACCAMILTGILSFKDVFTQMGSSTVWLFIALGVMGRAILKTGLMDALGEKLHRSFAKSEKRLLIVLYLLSAVCSWFINGLVVVIVFMSVIDQMVIESGGAITRKHTYYPVALGAGLGSLCSSIGSSAMMNVSAQMAASPLGRPMGLLEPFPIGIAVVLAGLVFYMTVGYPLQKKVFSWPDIPPELSAQETRAERKPCSKAHKIITLATLAAMLAAIGFSLLDTGVISVLTVLILILTGCVTEKEAWNAVDWKTVILVVGALGLGQGVSKSGAGQLIAEFILSRCGALQNSPYAMCIVCLVVCMLLSNFMANNSAAAIMVPIAINLATAMGVSILPFGIACGIGVNLAIATPVCRTLVTITMPAGYNFKTMGIVGGILQLIVTVVAALVLLFYF